MKTLKSIVNVVEENLDTERLTHSEDEGKFSAAEVKKDKQSHRESYYDDYRQPFGLSQNKNGQLIAKTESRISISEYSLVSGKQKLLSNAEAFLPDKKAAFSDASNSKCWNLHLRCPRVSGIGKVWRPVFVELKGSTITLHAEDFQSSPPFQIINLTWFYSFSKPEIKAKLINNEFLFTCLLVNTFRTTPTRVRHAETRPRGVKLGCANYSVLLNFIETVRKFIDSFPAFRAAGIFYKAEMVIVKVRDTFEIVERERYAIVDITQQERQALSQIAQPEKEYNVSSKQVEIMLRAKVTASPECSMYVKHTEMFSKQPAIDEVRFHKCVKSCLQNNQTTTVRFVPLDNCWFQLMSWKGACSKPAPLRCEVTVSVCAKRCVQIQARLFTSSTRVEVTSARDITIRLISQCVLL